MSLVRERCAYCNCKGEPGFPVSLFIDNGGSYWACADAKTCGTRKVSA